jgi:5-methylthioadenosine/S-adenosylhomocysteine deaminase
MALILAGRIVPLARRGDDVVDGRVFIGDDGRVVAVRKGRSSAPAGFAGVPTVDTSGVIYPGLIDLHGHTAYNTLPLWTEPRRREPWLHHNSWTGSTATTYHSDVVWPAGVLGYAAGPALLAFIALKALVGGTTSIQGSVTKPKLSAPFLVRVVENEATGPHPDPIRTRTLTTTDPGPLVPYVRGMNDGQGFIYHCAEGQPDSVVTKEYDALATAQGLVENLIAIHCNALDGSDFARWSPRPGTLVWSPFSNLWLYGQTTDVVAARDAGLRLALGSDWAPSGTKHVLGELKVADLWNRSRLGGAFTERELVEMVTANPGDALAGPWSVPVGRLIEGALGDVIVVSDRDADPWRNLITATEHDVDLVVVGGRPRYGRRELMEAAGADPLQSLTIAGERRAVSLHRIGDPATGWPVADIRAELNAVRSDPGKAVSDTRDRAAAFAAAVSAGQPVPPAPPLVVVGDMATADTASGGVPADPSKVKIPPLDRLWHDRGFFARVDANPIHGGALSGLRAYYPEGAP